MPSTPDFAGAVAATSAVLRTIDDEQLPGPTPSAAYTVADLIEHVDGLSSSLQLTARKTPPPAFRDGDGTQLADGWRQRIPRQLAELAAAWSDPAAWQGETRAGGVTLPASAAGMFALDEVIVHGWELARSTHQPYDTDEDAARACAEFLSQQPRNDELFAPAVPVADDASALDRLIGLTGRSPQWCPPVVLPPIADKSTWETALAQLRTREKAATRELDALAAARRRLPMVELPDYTLEGADGPVRLRNVFAGKRQLIVYNHMWFPDETWQCGGCTGLTSQFTRLEFLDPYDARFVIVTQGPIEEALAYKARVGNKMEWYSTAHSPFGSDLGAPPGGGFQVNVLLRDGDTVYRTYNTQGRGTEQLSHTFPLVDLLPYGRQEDWQDSPAGWPQTPAGSKWAPVEAFSRYAD